MASPAQVAEMRANYESGGYGYGHAKQALHELMQGYFKEAREKFDYFIAHPEIIEEKLAIGEQKVKPIAEATIARIRAEFKF
jgi:tryptophanyl-tRNA synthetase